MNPPQRLEKTVNIFPCFFCSLFHILKTYRFPNIAKAPFFPPCFPPSSPQGLAAHLLNLLDLYFTCIDP